MIHEISIIKIIPDIVNCLLTLGIVFFAFMQWKCSDIQRKNELFKYRVNHLQELKNFWESLNKNMNFIRNEYIKYNLPENYEAEYNYLDKFFEEHALYTNCYFNNELYDIEQKFIKMLFELLPPSYIDATIYNIDKTKFKNLTTLYNQLYNTCLNMTLSENKIMCIF